MGTLVLDEPLWTCKELTFAIKRLKNNKATDVGWLPKFCDVFLMIV